MNTLFLLVCGMSVVFFGYFFIECHRETSRRKRRGSSVIAVSPGVQATESYVGRHSMSHLEKQMVDFLTHDHRSADAACSPRIASLDPAVRP